MNKPAENQPRENSHGRTEAFYASQKDDTGDLLLERLRAGDDPDAVDDRGDTVLHWTSWNNRFNAMRILLEHGANPNIQNNKGHTPLHHVINRNKVGTPFMQVARLLNAGADPLLADHGGNSVYHAVALRSSGMPPRDALAIAEILSEKGGTDGWFIPNHQDKSPLDLAADAKDPNLGAFVSALQATVLERTTEKARQAAAPSPGRRL